MAKRPFNEGANEPDQPRKKKPQDKINKPKDSEHHRSAVSPPSYAQDPKLTALSQSEVDSYLETNSIQISDQLDQNITLRPITSFSYLPQAHEHLYEPLKAFSEPTPIQATTWPFLFAGRDVIGIAETGSGKTLAFGLPCIRRLMPRGGTMDAGVKAVMVTPTRELAIQVYKQIVELAGSSAANVVCVYGGVSKDEQRMALKKASVVVATPGRLKDLLNDRVVDLRAVEYLVLDEADRMLDKGFEDDIRDIVSNMPRAGHRQTLMFTATWPMEIRELAATFTKSPVHINVGSSSTELRANPRITQVVEVVDSQDKESRLLQLLSKHQQGKKGRDKILVFCLYKKEATRVERFIRSRGYQVAGIHGDLSQHERVKSLDAFKSGSVALLVATDVAARGLDIPAVKLVLNLTFPLTVEDYVHRIGR